MPLLFSLLAVLLLAGGAGAQARTPEDPVNGAFYAEGDGGGVAVRLFGTVRVRADSVEVLVSEGSVARPWVSFIRREEPYARVRLRAHLSGGAGGEPDMSDEEGLVEVLRSLGPGEEHPVRRVRFVLPTPEGTPDRLGLVFQVIVTDSPSSHAVDRMFMVYACGKYGALALPQGEAEGHGGCGVSRARRAAVAEAASARLRARPPTRKVCVEDPAAPHGLRLSDVIVERLPGDSALGRSGERRLLSEFRPRIVGYAAGSQGLEPAGTNVMAQEPWVWVQLFGTRYVPFGLPRTLPPQALVRIGEAMGASVFVAPGTDLFEIAQLFILRPDCTFQPYQQPMS